MALPLPALLLLLLETSRRWQAERLRSRQRARRREKVTDIKTFDIKDKKVTFRALRRSFGLNIVVFSDDFLGKAEKALFWAGK